MKQLKYLDLAGQLLVLVGGIVYATIVKEETGFGFITVYFLVGGWQLASFMIHLFACNCFWLDYKGRALYGKTILISFGIGVLSLGLGTVTEGVLLLLFLIILLFATPAFAIWYFIICFDEIQTIKSKELIHLK